MKLEVDSNPKKKNLHTVLKSGRNICEIQKEYLEGDKNIIALVQLFFFFFFANIKMVGTKMTCGNLLLG